MYNYYIIILKVCGDEFPLSFFMAKYMSTRHLVGI